MKNVFRRRPSASMVVAIAALVIAMSGTAVAASLVNGDTLIQKHSLSGNRIRYKSLTGYEIKLSKLGTVPRAGSAAISKLSYVTSTASVAPSASSGPQTITATCPSGTDVIGGGGQVGDESKGYLNDTYPSGTSGWSATFFNTGSTPAHDTVTAICAPAAATG